MCSFLVTSFLVANLTFVNQHLKPRGPDRTSFVRIAKLSFVHNLLSMTGCLRSQPFRAAADLAAALFNGEIYNWRELVQSVGLHAETAAEVDVLTPLYRRYGPTFSRRLHGEFALVLVDFRRELAIVATDAFGTKPLWYARRGDRFGLASYPGALRRLGAERPRPVPPNSIAVLDIRTGHWRTGFRTLYEFDLRQWKTSTDDFVAAFQNSMSLRTRELKVPPFVGLSSGYDSGSVALALHLLGVQHYLFSIQGLEDMDIVRQRIDFAAATARAVLLRLGRVHLHAEDFFLQVTTEDAAYMAAAKTKMKSVLNDPASQGLSAVSREARKFGALVYLSGMGADEIISDYGSLGARLGAQSSFGGLFPENLGEIYPWSNFFLGTQRDFLAKEELVAGAHGIETRYPFLDTHVVQEFLWLAPEVKNRRYKAALHDFFDRAGYPVKSGKTPFYPLTWGTRLLGHQAVQHLCGRHSCQPWKRRHGRCASRRALLAKGIARGRKLPTARLVPTIVASHYDADNGLRMQLRLLELQGYRPEVLGLGRTWKNMRTLNILEEIREFLEASPEAVGPGDVIMKTDAFDLLPNGCTQEEVLRRYQKVGCDVVVSSEKFCYPPQHMEQDGLCKFFAERAVPSAPFAYPNGGCWLGEASAVSKLFGEPFPPSVMVSGSDQHFFAHLVAQTLRHGQTTTGHRVCMDVWGDICWPMAHEALDKRNVEFYQHAIRKSEGPRRPPRVRDRLGPEVAAACFHHFNGPWWNKRYMADAFVDVYYAFVQHPAQSAPNKDHVLLQAANSTRRGLRRMEFVAGQLSNQREKFSGQGLAPVLAEFHGVTCEDAACVP